LQGLATCTMKVITFYIALEAGLDGEELQDEPLARPLVYDGYTYHAERRHREHQQETSWLMQIRGAAFKVEYPDANL
jgi:hypothetical protein